LASLDAQRYFLGGGDSARFKIFEWLAMKASYEYAVRMPSLDELVGDRVLVHSSPDLRPETSHNVNLGLNFAHRRLDVLGFPLGGLSVGVDGFYRETDDLIVQRGDATGVFYQNVFHVRTIGVEGAAQWTSPGGWVVLDGNTTYQEVRNASTQGEAALYTGQRIPNRPWFFANWGARLVWRDALLQGDEITPFYNGRYIHEFFRNWESIGDPDTKLKIPDQLVHSLGASYNLKWPARVGLTFEVENLLDAATFDFFGVQRPGLSLAFKATCDF